MVPLARRTGRGRTRGAAASADATGTPERASANRAGFRPRSRRTDVEKKLIIQENKETKSYSIKEISAKKEFPFSKYIQRNIEYKLIFKQIFQNEVFIVTGLFDGELHLYLNTNKTVHNSDKYELLIDTSY